MQDYCNRGQDNRNKGRKTGLNSAETKGSRVSKQWSEQWKSAGGLEKGGWSM